MLAQWAIGVSFCRTLAPDPLIDAVFVEVMLTKIDSSNFLTQLKFLIANAAGIHIIVLLWFII